MNERKLLDYLLLSLKGIGMGAADVVPGVSGGTVAFISGIYEELITSINSINLQAFKTLRKEGVASFWNHINGTFFIFLFAGIGISIISLAKVVSHLLHEFPILIWSFFFGLIIASILLIGKTIVKWKFSTIGALIIGATVAYYITTIQAVANIDANWYILLSGAIAICAMILPGVSGAFILLLLGSYDRILTAISTRNSTDIILFAIGCLIGLLSFARVLKYLFSKHKDKTIAVLTGFMIGSLNKVWPWKETLSTRINSHGETVPFIQENILPSSMKEEPQIMYAVLCMVSGLVMILLLEWIGSRKTNENG